ncbi:putative HTH-type transcriptional regulator [Paenibacillus solanacearum]|uniref:HTH-type transcriptional regulator n=1 Tax=Paenibacillus solanacearum TaxID=2048548 RepID=A0A916NLU0_9BACL|nr:MerR family transcriptional regulator [Paenibacillus solanacearum]CAG7650488.1 putative HTH-type transcriptional regulator [Paenibacillus solanacearum]
MTGQTFTIAEAAEMTGLSLDTLRYYEKIGLIASPKRGAGGQRMYSSEDVGKIQFVTYLKRTNMPLKKILAYVQSYNKQDEDSCYALLDEHRASIECQLTELNTTLQLIKYKLEHFQEIKDGTTKGGTL